MGGHLFYCAGNGFGDPVDFPLGFIGQGSTSSKMIGAFV
jgi:hypothetical protein